MKVKKSIGRKMLRAKQMKDMRIAETPYVRERRLQASRSRNRETRETETNEDRNLRIEHNRLRNTASRASETAQERKSRLANMRLQTAASRTTLRNSLSMFNNAAFRYNHEIDYSSHSSVIIGAMNAVCTHCQAFKFKNETPGMCCADGKVRLPELNCPPEPLLSLVSCATAESRHFLTNIRKYNACFQMTSFGATKIIRDSFMPTFKVQGQIYHRAGSLLPLSNSQHKFLQIYFMGDEIEQINQRCSINSETRRSIVSSLQTLLNEHNELIRLFKTALTRMTRDEYKIVIKADKTPVGQHERRFNAPTINEVAIVIVGEQFESRDIILHRRNNNIERYNNI